MSARTRGFESHPPRTNPIINFKGELGKMVAKSTTSFYSTEQEFKKYLGHTSYYTELQKNLLALLSPKAKIVIDLGCGIGSTAIQIAKKCNQGIVHATDIRQEILELGKKIAKREHISNIEFDKADMNNLGNYLADNNLRPDIITALYAFHHIADPLENKQRVVNEIYENMKKGGWIIIGDVYLELDCSNAGYASRVKKQYDMRCEEAYNSVFWAVVRERSNAGKDVKKVIDYAHEVAEYSRASELNAMKGVLNRSKAVVPEYLITMPQLRQIFEKAGFRIIVFQPINSIGDAIMIGKK